MVDRLILGYAIWVATLLSPSALLLRKVRLTGAHKVLAFVMLFQFLAVWTHQTEFPNFPQFAHDDFLIHLNLTQDLLTHTPTLNDVFLYGGIRFLLAFGLILVRGEPLATLMHLMNILVLLSPLVVFFSMSKFLRSQWVGVASAFVWSLGGFVWFGMVDNAGLWPNFYGVLSVFLLLWATMNSLEQKASKVAYVFYVLSVLNLFVSHYSVLTMYPAFLSFLALHLRREHTNIKVALRYVAPLLLPSLFLFLDPQILTTLLALISQPGGGTPATDTWLAILLLPVPVLSYMVTLITSDVEAVVLLLLLVPSFYAMMKKKDLGLFFLFAWFFSVLVVSPQGVIAWRFSFIALVSLVPLAAYGFYSMFSIFSATVKEGRSTYPNWKGVLLLVILVPWCVWGSWGMYSLAGNFQSMDALNQAQNEDIRFLNWVNNSTRHDSTILFLTNDGFLPDWTPALTGRNVFYEFQAFPQQAVFSAVYHKAQYIVTTQLVFGGYVPASSSPFFLLNSTNLGLPLAFKTEHLHVYRLVK